MWTIRQGDALDVLRSFPSDTFQVCTTSPPYWGLRSYGTDPQVWGGDPACDHRWREQPARARKGNPNSGLAYSGTGSAATRLPGLQARADNAEAANATGAFCKCGAWRGELGMEPSPELYVEHLVWIFREVRRVLRLDGVLWLNLGDCYVTEPHGKGDAYDPKHPTGRTRGGDRGANRQSFRRDRAEVGNVRHRRPSWGLKHKDLAGIPHRVKDALQADGWWHRSTVVWCLSGGVWVYARTQKGDMPVMVKDLVRLNPATVRLWTGERWTRTLGWNRSADTEERVEITLRSGERIGCTGPHAWPTQRGAVAARDLIVGDTLSTCTLPESEGCVAPPYLTKEVCWLAGLYLAEGSRADDTVQLSLHADEVAWLPRLGAASAHLGASMTHTVDGDSLAVRLYGRVLAAAIESFVGGRTALDKHLRVEAWRLPKSYLRAIIAGYLDGDAHHDDANKRHRLDFARNYALERDLRTAAARLGATLTLHPTVVTYQGGKRAAFRGEWRWTRSGHHNEKDRGEVVALGRSRARRFWDIGVEDEPHTFALASGVLTHNSKPNPMPESIDDRPTTSHEYLFLLARSGDSLYWTHRDGRGTRRRPRPDFIWRNRQTGEERREDPPDVPDGEFDPWIRVNLWKGHDYFYDADSIREPHTYGDHARNGVQGTVVQAPGQVPQSGITMRRALGNRKVPRGWDTGPGDHRGLEGRYRLHPGARGMPPQPAEGGAFHPAGRNKRSVWTIPTQPFPEAHFATFPEDLVLPCLLAGASAGGACVVCGAPRERVVAREFVSQPDVSIERGVRGAPGQKPMDVSNSWEQQPRGVTNHYMRGWQPTCECQTEEPPRACKVLDPFCGAATVGKVATRLGLDFDGVELSAEYVAMSKRRIEDDAPLFNRPEEGA